MNYVQKMAEATTEVCFSSGMENLSFMLGQRMDDTRRNVEKQVKENTLLEVQYNIIQEQSIKKSNCFFPSWFQKQNLMKKLSFPAETSTDPNEVEPEIWNKLMWKCKYSVNEKVHVKKY